VLEDEHTPSEGVVAAEEAFAAEVKERDRPRSQQLGTLERVAFSSRRIGRTFLFKKNAFFESFSETFLPWRCLIEWGWGRP